MANKRSRTPAESATQKKRTSKNLATKYLKLIEDNPKSPHVKLWEKNVEYYSKQ